MAEDASNRFDALEFIIVWDRIKRHINVAPMGENAKTWVMDNALAFGVVFDRLATHFKDQKINVQHPPDPKGAPPPPGTCTLRDIANMFYNMLTTAFPDETFGVYAGTPKSN